MIVTFRKQQRAHPPIHINGTVVERVESFKFLGVHITDKQMVLPHRQRGEEGTTAPLQPQEAEEMWLVSQTFTMHNREHPVGLYHSLVRQLLRPQPYVSPEGSEVCTTHHRGQTTCPPGHLHHPMSQEGQKDHQGQQPPEPLPVHPAIIQKVRSVQVRGRPINRNGRLIRADFKFS